ncbi:divalent cation tolerance protein CutA [Nocardia salmonicida]|uniref:divalent-cation tolerance protein CutA n=1 Tax=Nocardia salmonicida TaxID=53431 RepID=UPI002E2910DF|nr:divalent cation tolerance protein CutA [Nocardia salmonicida]
MTSESRVWAMTTTLPTEHDAHTIAASVVGERLAAGAEIVKQDSVFWHLGEVGTGPECRLTFRVAAAGRDRLAERIAELHPWSGPEISATPVPWTIEKYAQWVERPTASQE